MPSQELWRPDGEQTLTSLNLEISERSEVRLAPQQVELHAGGAEDFCDTVANACTELEIVLTLRLPTIEHVDPDTGELSFITEKPELTAFGTMMLDAVHLEENVYRASELEVRSCSRLQSAPPDGRFRPRGYRQRWAGEFALHVARDEEERRAALRFSGLPLALTSNAISCTMLELYLSGELELER